jgi:hypothetical protein
MFNLNLETMSKKTTKPAASKDVKMLQANDVETIDRVNPEEEFDVDKNAKDVKQHDKVTKKSVIIKMISTPEGSTINDMARAIVDQGIDLDLEKNKRVVRLWLTKIGFKVKRDKESGKYSKE